MPYPPEDKMPDLSKLPQLTNRLMVQALVGEPGITPKVSLYRKNFVRLIDKAIIEYREARQVILEQIGEAKRPAKEMEKNGRYINVFGFTNHIENCINALCRVSKLLNRIKTEKGSPKLPRDLRKTVEKDSLNINEIRNKVEHIDELIHNDELAPNKPIMLALSEDSSSAMISDYELKFSDLSLLITKVHEIGEYVLTIKSC
jgi:hypothetical protein